MVKFGPVAAALVVVFVSTGFSDGNEGMTYNGPVAAGGIDVPVIPSYRGPVDDETTVPRHRMPPLDQIPPASMPIPLAAYVGTASDHRMLAHDAISGETRILDIPAMRFGGPQRRGGSIPPDWFFGEVATKNFGTMVERDDEHLLPWRMNAKLVMRFETASGGTLWTSCSGSMLDAEVVLTAAHCLYDHNPKVMDWAREVYVLPGWDDAGVYRPPDGSVETHGYAVGTYFYANSDFVDSQDMRYDVGLVRVTRAVGALTGWYGWSSGAPCVVVEGRSMVNVGYPAEDCGQPGLHSGLDMYVWGGAVDACSANWLSLDTTPGCFTAVWGGMSGSSMYYKDGSDYYAEAVCSASDRAYIGSYARLYDGFVAHLSDTFIPEARGAEFDLQVLRFRSNATSYSVGDEVAGSFVLANATNGTAPSTFWNFNVYLSDNDEVTPSDSLLLDAFVPGVSFPAMQTSTVAFGLQRPTIPYNTPTGTHWLGAVLDNGQDADDSNNNTEGWDSQEITVAGVTDLRAIAVDVPSGTFLPGTPLAINYTVDNIGGDPSDGIKVWVRASKDTNITETDVHLASHYPDPIPGNGSTTEDRTLWLSSVLDLRGDYYIGIIAETSNDVFTGNNVAYDPIPITVTLPDLIFAETFDDGTFGGFTVVSP